MHVYSIRMSLFSISVITKFELGEENIRLVLRDGCIIDDEDVFQQLESNELFVLKADEVLKIPQASSSPSGGPEAGVMCSNIQIFMDKIYLPKSRNLSWEDACMHS